MSKPKHFLFSTKKKCFSHSLWLWISLHCFCNHWWVGLIVWGWRTSWHVFLSVTTESGKVVCWTASVSFRCGKPKYQWRTWCVPKMFVIVSFACDFMWYKPLVLFCFYISYRLRSHWKWPLWWSYQTLLLTATGQFYWGLM